MSLLAIRIDEVTEGDLASLITEKIPESAVLEYKRATIGLSDKDRYEFMADVSSFANSAGGEILFGVDESNGVPSKLVGLDITNIDQEILRLEQIIRTGSRPTIRGISSRAIPLSLGKPALIMRIPKSWDAPHQIGQLGSFRFFGRASNGKYQLDVDALRSAFRQGPEFSDRVRSFRSDRLSKVISNTGPAKLQTGSKVVVHLVPVGLFSAGVTIDLSAVRADSSLLSSVLQAGGRTRVNLDGYLASASSQTEGTSGYLQLFRDGKLEVVEHIEPWHVRGHNFLPGQHFDEMIQNVIRGALKLYKALGVDAPILAMLTLLGMQGRLMGAGERWGYQGRVAFEASEILCPDVLIEDLTASPESTAFPLVNPVWNAAGYEQSVFYDKHGHWIEK